MSCAINMSSRLKRAVGLAGTRSWYVRTARISLCAPGVDTSRGNLARVRTRGGATMWHKFVLAVPITALVLGGATACASKKFVRTSVGEVNDKVDSLGKSVEQTQERTRQSEGRIADVDQRAQAA